MLAASVAAASGIFAVAAALIQSGQRQNPTSVETDDEKKKAEKEIESKMSAAKKAPFIFSYNKNDVM